MVGFSLTLGAAAIDLASAWTGNATLANVVLAVKFSKTGWTLFAPSKKQLAALQFAGAVPQKTALSATGAGKAQRREQGGMGEAQGRRQARAMTRWAEPSRRMVRVPDILRVTSWTGDG